VKLLSSKVIIQAISASGSLAKLCLGHPMLHRPPINKLAHHRIAAKKVGVVDIPAPAKMVASQLCRHVRQPEGVILLAMQ
jgi:hypothetical protein